MSELKKILFLREHDCKMLSLKGVNMVTLNEYRTYGSNRNVLSLVGLTTDTLPTDMIENAVITNGSTVTILDPTTKSLSKVMMFDEENHQWCDL